MSNKSIRKQVVARYRQQYDGAKYGRAFLSGRFLKMWDADSDAKDTVFDKRNSAFIHYADAVIEHKIENGGKV